jgi:hypothetical protein
MGQPDTGQSLLREIMATSTSIDSRARNVTSQPLVNPEKVSLPLHIKIGIVKVFLRLWIEMTMGLPT